MFINARPLNLDSPMVLLCHVLSLRMAENERSHEQETTGKVSNSSQIVVILGNMFPTFAKLKADDKVICRPTVFAISNKYLFQLSELYNVVGEWGNLVACARILIEKFDNCFS